MNHNDFLDTLQELLGYNADIMCLQEVDNKIFNGDLDPIFSQNGYCGKFDMRDFVEGEGTACFWNNDKFEKLNASKMVFGETVKVDNNSADILAVLNVNEGLKEKFMKISKPLQIVILKSKDHSEGLIVGNAHLFHEPNGDHFRLLQISMIMRQLEKVKNSAEKEFDTTFSVLLSGDFNSTPVDGVLEFMRNKVIHENHIDWSSAKGIYSR